MNRLSFRLLLFNLVAVIILLSLSINPLYSSFLFNFAQLKRVHGVFRLDLYSYAIEMQPENSLFRWQTGSMLLEQGDVQSAAKILRPLLNQSFITSEQFQTLANVFGNSSEKKLLLELYARSPRPLLLHSTTASIILQEYLLQKKAIPLVYLQSLISQGLLLAPTTPSFQLLDEQLRSPNFWLTRTSNYLRSTLLWQFDVACNVEPCFYLRYKLRKSQEHNLETVAEMINISKENLKIGSELVINGYFEQMNCYPLLFAPAPTTPANSCNLQGWMPVYMNTGKPWNRGTFIIGTDKGMRFHNDFSIRIDGIVLERKAELQPSRAGIWYEEPILVYPQQSYLLSFLYRTQSVRSPGAALWVSEDPLIFFNGDIYLEPTIGKWKQVTIIAWNRSEQIATIRPLLRSFSEGSVWFDDFSIRSLDLPKNIIPQEPVITFSETHK